MAQYNRFMGGYDDNTNYEKGDVVTFDGAAWYRKLAGSGISPIARKKPYTVWSRLNEDLSTIFPLGGGGGSGTGLPSDVGAYKYMATDGNGDWKAEDRLAWKEEKSTTLFDGEPELVGSSYGFGSYKVGGNEPDNITLNLSSTYTVVFDGVTYSDVQPIVVSTDTGAIGLQISQDDAPVVMLTDSSHVETNPTSYLVMGAPGEENHTLILIEHAENIHKISPELLPEGIGYKEGEKVEITWDGNTEGLVSVGEYYKVSDEILTSDMLKAGVVTFNSDGQIFTYVMSDEENWSQVRVEDGGMYFNLAGLYCVNADNAVLDGKTFPQAGVYFGSNPMMGYTAGLTVDNQTIRPIPAEYLPCFNVNVAYDADSDVYVSDKTYEQIKAAEAQKKAIVGTFTHKDGMVFTLIGCDLGEAEQCKLIAFDLNTDAVLCYYLIKVFGSEETLTEVLKYKIAATFVEE